MAAPAKPWESGGPNLRSSLGVTNNGTSPGLYSSTPVAPMTGAVSRVPPPVPNRVGTTGNRQSYGGNGQSYGGAYGSSYGMGSSYGGYGTSYGGYGGGYNTGYGSGYGMGGYGSGYGMGGYSSGYGMGGYGSRGYGGYGMNGMNNYSQPHMNSLESRFIQMAEENSRPAFESIESLVHAFGSVSFMMESTFSAIYSSFRAVLGVAENFGRLRTLFGQVFQTFALLRMFQWMYRKLLFYLGIRRDNPGREAIWQEVTGEMDPKTKKTVWPMAMFLCLVCAGPYLVWRLLRSLNIASPSMETACDPRAWIDTNGRMAVGIALYDFPAAQENELTVRRSQGLYVAPQHLQPPNRDWVLVTHNWKDVGLVPANYIQVVDQRREVKLPPRAGAVPEFPAYLETMEPIVAQQDPSFGHREAYPARSVHFAPPPGTPSGDLDDSHEPSASHAPTPQPSAPVPQEQQSSTSLSGPAQEVVQESNAIQPDISLN